MRAIQSQAIARNPTLVDFGALWAPYRVAGLSSFAMIFPYFNFQEVRRPFNQVTNNDLRFDLRAVASELTLSSVGCMARGSARHKRVRCERLLATVGSSGGVCDLG